jgi:hypothetical protein
MRLIVTGYVLLFACGGRGDGDIPPDLVPDASRAISFCYGPDAWEPGGVMCGLFGADGYTLPASSVWVGADGSTSIYFDVRFPELDVRGTATVSRDSDELVITRHEADMLRVTINNLEVAFTNFPIPLCMGQTPIGTRLRLEFTVTTLDGQAYSSLTDSIRIDPPSAEFPYICDEL